MAAPINKDQVLADRLIAQELKLSRFTAGERQAVLKLLKNLEDELIVRLFHDDKPLSELRRADLGALLREAQELIAQHYEGVTDRALSGLDEFGRVEASATAQALGAAFAYKITPALPSETFFKALIKNTLIEGAPSSEWWAGQDADYRQKFANAVRQGLTAGETNAQIISRVRRDVMMQKRAQAAAQVQTSVATVASAARDETFKKNDDLIAGYRQVSVLDSHTTVICVAYSGATWDKNREPTGDTTLPFINAKGAATGCPRHWNCRSLIVPTTVTFKSLGIDLPEFRPSTKAASGGPVSSKMQFDQYLERQGKARTDEQLGKGRAELWRDGKISLQQLLDQNGRPLTLQQLKEAYDL